MVRLVIKASNLIKGLLPLKFLSVINSFGVNLYKALEPRKWVVGLISQN